MPLRYAAQDRVTRELASWMAGRLEVARVFHPALAGSPGHEVLAAGGRHAGAVRRGLPVLGGLQPHYSARQVDAFVDALQLFGIGYSWAGP
jgi:cystathionine beta-lyase